MTPVGTGGLRPPDEKKSRASAAEVMPAGKTWRGESVSVDVSVYGDHLYRRLSSLLTLFIGYCVLRPQVKISTG